MRSALTSNKFWESLEKLHSNVPGGRLLVHNGDVMTAVVGPPINPVRIREKGSTKLTGSCYSGWLGAPEPSERATRVGQSHTAVSHTGL